MIAAVDPPHGRDPFAFTANPKAYVPSVAIDCALTQTLTALGTGHVPVIVGPPGLGKTLLLHLTAHRLVNRYTALYVPFTAVAPAELAKLVLGLLGRPIKGDAVANLLDEVRRLHASQRPLLLLVDDAASLPKETARELADWIGRTGRSLHVVMATLPQSTLHDVLAPFGRTVIQVSLTEGLRRDEIARYVDGRLTEAEATRELRARFDDATLENLSRVSEGNPRRLHLAAQELVRMPVSASAVAASAARESIPIPISTPAAIPMPVVAPAPAPTPVRTPPRVPTPAPPPTLAPTPAPTETPVPTPPPEQNHVGEYRFVRGRDLDSNAPPPRVSPREPQVDLTLAAAVEGTARVPRSRREAAAPLVTPPIPATDTPRWIRRVAVGVAIVAFVFGVLTQFPRTHERSAVPTPSATSALLKPPATQVEPGIAPAAAPSTEAKPAREAERVALVPAVEPIRVVEPPKPAIAVAKPAPVQPVPSPSEPEPVASVAPEPTPAPIPEVAPVRTVKVSINATPWAIIEIDGVEIGETPLAGIELAVGPHRFRARMPDGSLRKKNVEIDDANTTVVFE